MCKSTDAESKLSVTESCAKYQVMGIWAASKAYEPREVKGYQFFSFWIIVG